MRRELRSANPSAYSRRPFSGKGCHRQEYEDLLSHITYGELDPVNELLLLALIVFDGCLTPCSLLMVAHRPIHQVRNNRLVRQNSDARYLHLRQSCFASSSAKSDLCVLRVSFDVHLRPSEAATGLFKPQPTTNPTATLLCDERFGVLGLLPMHRGRHQVQIPSQTPAAVYLACGS